MADYDAIVIGSGHNGLTSALCLAEAGWRVLVLERAAEIGGGMRSAEITLPGLKHDLFATNVGLFAASPVYRQFRDGFDDHGVRFLTSEFAFASAYPDARAARVYTDPDRMARELSRFAGRDLAGWRHAFAFFQRAAPKFLPLNFTAMPSMAMARRVGGIWCNPADAVRLSRVLWQTSRRLADGWFDSEEVKGLFTPWAFHADFGPDVHGGAMFSFVAAMSAHERGLFITEGGTGRIPAAFQALIEMRGGTVRTNSEISRIHVRNGAAVAVETAAGEEISAARAIVAGVTPRNLFGRLVRDDDIPPGFLRRIRRFRYGIGTFVVHLALARPLQWRAADDLSEFNTVHICGTAEDIANTYRQSLAGQIPARPLLIVSQTTQIDPSRAPTGRYIARIHSRSFPERILGDAAGGIEGRDWDAVKQAVADRLVDLLAEHAPNVRDAMLARHVVSPLDLERENPNLIGGDCNSGSHHLDQNYFMRPILGWSRYDTPIDRLHMVGSFTWPGGGIHGAAGYLLAQQLIGSTV